MTDAKTAKQAQARTMHNISDVIEKAARAISYAQAGWPSSLVALNEVFAEIKIICDRAEGDLKMWEGAMDE